MISLYNRLFRPIVLTEEDASQELEDTGLVSPYSVPRKAMTTLAIDEIEGSKRDIGYLITNTHRNCAPAIDLIKRIDLEGFLTFKARTKETLELNGILDGNDVLQDQLAELFTWAYAEVSRKKEFLIFTDKNTAKKIAAVIYSKLDKAGLKFPPGKISQLFTNVLITVLTKLDHGKQKA